MSSAVIKAAQKFFQSGHAYVHKKAGYVDGGNERATAPAGEPRPQPICTPSRAKSTPSRAEPNPRSHHRSHAYTHAHTHSFRADKVTSVVIPLAMAGTTSLLWARGMLNLYTGAGKLEDQ